MKVLVINEPFIKNFCRCQRWPARTRGRALRPPDWLAYVTAVLEKEGIDVELYDFVAERWGKDKLRYLVKDKRPDFVILDSTTPSIYSDIKCAQIIKEVSSAKVIMVGTHISALPEETLQLAQGAVDVGCIGEFDYTVLDVIENFDNLDKVKGIAYWKNGKVVKTQPRPLIENLDDLPFPAWRHIDIMKYFDATRLYPYIDIIGGRGCPFKCIFCQWPQLMYGNKYRLRSPKNIVDEIEYDLKIFPQLKRGEFFFEDDTFTVSKERAFLICEEIRRRNLKITWSANARPDIYDVKLFKEMRKAGCRELLVGFESGSQDILNNIKKDYRIEEAYKFMEATRKAGIEVHGCFVLGLPGENKETIRKTINFALSLGVNTLQFSAALPLPGTEYFEWCKNKGLLKSKDWRDWLRGNEQGAVVDYENLTIQEINKAVDEGLKKFYLNPKFIFKFIFKNRNWNDLYRKIRGGLNFLEYLFKKYI